MTSILEILLTSNLPPVRNLDHKLYMISKSSTKWSEMLNVVYHVIFQSSRLPDPVP